MYDVRRTGAVIAALVTLFVGGVAVALPASAEQTASCSTTQTARPLGTAIKGAIEISGDVDAYRVSVPSNQWVGISLINLPADFGFDVRTTSGDLLTSVSSATGVGFERVFRRFSAGTYCIRVFGIGTAHSSAQYALVPSALGNSMRLLNAVVTQEDGNFRVTGEVFNGTSAPRDNVRLNVSLKTSTGSVLSYDTVNAYSSSTMVRPGTAIAFSDFVYSNGAASVGFPNGPIADLSYCTLGDQGVRLEGVSHVRAYGIHTASAVAVNSSASRSMRMSLNQYDLAGKVVGVEWTSYDYVASLSTTSFVATTTADTRARRWLTPIYQEC